MRTGASALSIRPQPAPMALTPAAPSAGGMGLEGLLDLVLSNIWRIVLGVLAALIAGLAYLALSEPRFTASAALFIDPRTRKIVTEDTVQNSTINDTALFESQVSIIGSEAILRRVVERLDLVNDPEFASAGGNGLLATVRSRVSGTPVPGQADPVTRATERLSRNVRVRRAQNTYVVTIEAVSASPQKAARIANEISSAYLDDQAASKSESAARVNSLIDSRLDELRTQLRKAETSVDDFKRQNKIVTSEGGMLNEQRLTRLNTELVAVRGIVAPTRARLDELAALVKRGAGPESLPEAMASPTLQRLREQYSSVARREAALASQLQPRHPLLVDVRAQLATARREITAELQRVAAATNSEFQIAATREREIQRELERIEGEVAVTTTAQ
ncbi:MAG: GumC family protein, partial [Hyphomicrobiales bacterium]|nr:GumC family protein [Hyphomicrobiales bacterium]